MIHANRGDGLDELFHRLPVALYRTSPSGHVLAANPAVAMLLGYETPDELVDRVDGAGGAYVDPSEREEWRRVIETEGTVRDFVVRLRRRDGDVIWVADTASAVHDEEGQVLYYEGVLVDVTERVKASNSTTILTDVLDSTSDFVVVFDETGRLHYANTPSRRFFGLRGPVMGTMVMFDDVFGSLPWRRALAAGRRRWSGEYTLADAGGLPHPLWVVVNAHLGKDGLTYLSAIARDLSQMRATQQRLEDLVAAKDTFVATVSHELRNPLAGVVGLAEEMRDRFDEFGDAERHDLITLIAHQAAEMTSLVDDLLVAARDDVGDVAVVPEVVDVSEMVKGLVTGLDVEVDLPIGTELSAWADPQRLRQIVRNLLSNAQRHGGETLRVAVRRLDDCIVVTVSDDGPGVDPADADAIFEAYQRADGSSVKRGSVGLGLSVARQLARLMDGDLAYRRSENWTTFTLVIPSSERLGLRPA
jgi:PAS domain S-box-containing protein